MLSLAREVDLLSYFPSVFHEIQEIIEIANAEKKPLDGTWQAIEDSLNNQFITTANEEGVSRYEKMLKINVPATDTLETRRFRLLARFQEHPPYSNKVLEQILDSLLGKGQYVIERNVVNKTLKVKLELTLKGQFDTAFAMLERITPQNMNLIVELRYNQNSLLTKFKHTQLSVYEHEQLRSEVLS
ncbi:putative phage tail protein [Lysinibacillus telephonicus]|uniref:putative phage tail protein n=1 Tax=Lysinibacillus telephonicus TaxID=1714840 RepID=UPI003B9FBC41